MATGCPAPAPRASPAQTPPPVAAPERPRSTPTAADASLPAALAGEGVRPVVRALWRAIEAVDAGDADAMARAMTEDARWFPPGSARESVGGPQQLGRAMAPWTAESIELDLRRVIDLGGSPFVAQLSVGHDGGAGRYELVLMVEVAGDRISSIRHYGDPLGSVRAGPPTVEPPLGPPGPVERAAGPPTIEHVASTRALAEALERGDDETARALLAPQVVMHDVRARKTWHGPTDVTTAYRADLGPRGHLTIAHHYAGSQYVVVEGALSIGQTKEDDVPRERGFVDLHRLERGKIAETWHYLNRRDRPRKPASRTRHLAPDPRGSTRTRGVGPVPPSYP